MPPGFNALVQALIADRAARWPPVIMPATESALRFHPWRALSSAQIAPASHEFLAVHKHARKHEADASLHDIYAPVTYLPEAIRPVKIVDGAPG
jgi:hypothetical protein